MPRRRDGQRGSLIRGAILVLLIYHRLIDQCLIYLQGLHLGHRLAVPLLASILAHALATGAHRSDLGLEDRTVVAEARCLH